MEAGLGRDCRLRAWGIVPEMPLLLRYTIPFNYSGGVATALLGIFFTFPLARTPLSRGAAKILQTLRSYPPKL